MAELQRCYRHPDRETGVSCSECGRGICPDCMTFGSVGIRCPEHSGQARGAARVVQNVQRRSTAVSGDRDDDADRDQRRHLPAPARRRRAASTANSGWIFEHGALYGPLVAEWDWYRLITAAFLHYGPIHLAMNMLALWWIGRPLEDYLGPVRYLLLYLVSGLAGSAGAPCSRTRRRSPSAHPGAIFGILGAAIVLERQQTYVLGGSAITLLVVNLAFTFAVPGISIGGHLGGLAGGALCILALSRFGKGNAAYSRIDVVSIASLVAVGLLSVAVAYWKVRGYA